MVIAEGEAQDNTATSGGKGQVGIRRPFRPDHDFKGYRHMVKTTAISLSTHGNADIHDITDEVAGAIQNSKLHDGIITIFCPSSTSGLTTIEYEGGCLSDLRRLFDEIVPSNREYAHNERWHDGNGHSHIRAAVLGASLTVPFVEGRMTLGTWQQIIHVDFDTRPRQRQVVVQLIGE
jgi:secondary thiamine-phosphate synthase enzyme